MLALYKYNPPSKSIVIIALPTLYGYTPPPLPPFSAPQKQFVPHLIHRQNVFSRYKRVLLRLKTRDKLTMRKKPD